MSQTCSSKSGFITVSQENQHLPSSMLISEEAVVLSLAASEEKAGLYAVNEC